MGRGGSFSFFLPFFFFSFAPIHLLSLVERKGVRGDFAPACERDLCPLYFFSSLSLSLSPSLPDRLLSSHPCISPASVEGEVSVFGFSPSHRAQGLILWRVWGRSPDINAIRFEPIPGVSNVTTHPSLLPSTGPQELGIGTEFFFLLPIRDSSTDYSSSLTLLYFEFFDSNFSLRVLLHFS